MHVVAVVVVRPVVVVVVVVSTLPVALTPVIRVVAGVFVASDPNQLFSQD